MEPNGLNCDIVNMIFLVDHGVQGDAAEVFYISSLRVFLFWSR